MHKLTVKSTGVAVITPFCADGSVDYDALARIIHFLIDSGIDFLVALGTTGESVTLTNDETQAVFATFVLENKQRVPLIMGVGGNCTRSLVERFQTLDTTGFDAILSVTPYYNRPNQEGLYQHYMALDAVTPLPLFMYNVPGRTAVNMTAQTMVRIAHDAKHIVGVKDASGNMEQGAEIIAQSPKDFLVFSGDDETAIPLTLLGGDGVISVVAGGFPKVFKHGMDLALEKNEAEATQINQQFKPIIDLLFQEGNPAGIKAVSQLLGLCESNLRLPLVKPTDALVAALQPYVSKIN
ncbi:MAG: 4-hydroxy-tetrahydrodipicolinate synthase [Flavobacteriaceae bacterium]|nr:4-hydroxy-tetrahydrodipicolinate synthase [Flavobacteriaceae bacterium]|tara:strand:- start:88 stop:972 length:885 start_codon:yes stop_codon:yes gene_type:complete